MMGHSVRLADAKAQSEFVAQTRVRQIEITASVQRIHKLLVLLVAGFQAEADQVQRNRSCQFEAGIVADPSCKFLRQPNVFADMKLQAFKPVIAEHKPQFQRSKATAKRYLPIAIINHRARLSGFGPQIFGQHTQRLDQSSAVGNIKTIAIKIRKHPFVRVEAVAVGKFQPTVDVAKLGAERSRLTSQHPHAATHCAHGRSVQFVQRDLWHSKT